jgi:hypothetical protein
VLTKSRTLFPSVSCVGIRKSIQITYGAVVLLSRLYRPFRKLHTARWLINRKRNACNPFGLRLDVAAEVNVKVAATP